MKTIFAEENGCPIKITIDDKTLARINYWIKYLFGIEVWKHERVSCSMAYGTVKFHKDEDGVRHVVESADGPVLEIDRYCEGGNIRLKDTACYIEIYPGRAMIAMIGNEGPEYPLGEAEIQNIPDIYFTEEFIRYYITPLLYEYGRYFRYMRGYHMNDEQKAEFSKQYIRYMEAKKK